MRVSLGVLLSFPFVVASALAADLPVRKADLFVPPPAPPSISPFYVGVFGGGVFGGSGTSFSGKNIFCFDGAQVPAQGPCQLNGGGNGANGGSLGAAPRPGNSAFGGLRAGADFFVSRSFVVGAIADIAVMRRNSTSRFEYSNFDFPQTFGTDRGVLSSSLSSDWVGTLRAKLGYALNDQTILFATGGLAFVDVSASIRNEYDVVAGAPPVSALPGGPSVQRGSVSGVAVGYALGGGAEYLFTRHMSVSVDYLYYAASKSYTVSQVSGTPLTPPSFVAKARPSGHLVRLGVDYRL